MKPNWKAFDASWYSRPAVEFDSKEKAIEYAEMYSKDGKIHVDEETKCVTYRGPVYL